MTDKHGIQRCSARLEGTDEATYRASMMEAPLSGEYVAYSDHLEVERRLTKQIDALAEHLREEELIRESRDARIEELDALLRRFHAGRLVSAEARIKELEAQLGEVGHSPSGGSSADLEGLSMDEVRVISRALEGWGVRLDTPKDKSLLIALRAQFDPCFVAHERSVPFPVHGTGRSECSDRDAKPADELLADVVSDLVDGAATAADGPMAENPEQTRWFYEDQWWVKDERRNVKGGDVYLTEHRAAVGDGTWIEPGIPHRLIRRFDHDAERAILRPARSFMCSDGVERVETGEVRRPAMFDWYLSLGGPVKAGNPAPMRPAFPILEPAPTATSLQEAEPTLKTDASGASEGQVEGCDDCYLAACDPHSPCPVHSPSPALVTDQQVTVTFTREEATQLERQQIGVTHWIFTRDQLQAVSSGRSKIRAALTPANRQEGS